jgi:hypothetical protein
MTTSNLTDFAKAAESENLKAALRGIEQIESSCRRLRVVLFGGTYCAPRRVQFIRELQDGLGLLISAEGRQTLVEDIRANRATIDPPAPPATRESLVAAVEKAAMELTRYTEDSEDNTSRDYYTGEEELDEGEASDDPPEARADCCAPLKVVTSTNPLAHPPENSYGKVFPPLFDSKRDLLHFIKGI